MRNWRIISTIAAVVFAAIAGVLVWKYVDNADTRAQRNTRLVSVLVARSRIARGTVFDEALSDHLFATVKIPRYSLPPDRILPGARKALLRRYHGKVASTDIFTGTAVVAGQFVNSSQLVNTVAGAIPKGKEAITISLDQAHAVGGFVTPGDRVNVIFNFDAAALNNPATSSRPPRARTTTLLLAGIKVIAVGSTTVLPTSPPAGADSNGGPTSTTTPQQPGSLITLQVTPRQAQQIVQATTIGTVWLSLNPPGFDGGKFKPPREIVGGVNLFDRPRSTR